MKTFLTGVVLGFVLGLVACATAPAPTATPAALSTNTAPPAAPTNTSGPAVTRAPATPSETAAATATPAPTLTTAPSATPAATSTPAPAVITYQDFEILPAETIIKVGASVTFLIKAGLFSFHQPYNFTAPNIFEAPANLGEGATFAHTFAEAGRVTLLCGYHANMRAALIVQP
jgi:plastocyanin